MDTPDTSLDTQSTQRLDRLSQRGQLPRTHSPKYSLFIRRAKLLLPLLALAIVTLVFSWGLIGDSDIVPVVEGEKSPQTIGRNELLNPKFESMDSKKQPYTITALRAIQGENNESLVLLEKPLAEMTLTSGRVISMQALDGLFQQEKNQLALSGEVLLFDDSGYKFEMPDLNIDIKNTTAWTHSKIYGHGPTGTLYAQGMKANSTDGYLIFTGPIKLTLTQVASGQMLGGL